MNASEELQIRSLKIKNYRQYYGEQTIDLSTDNRNINIIQGGNGEGKSNILNAINYCLYLEEPHLRPDLLQLPVINLRAIYEANIGDEIPMEIELELGNRRLRYRITRRIFAKKSKLVKTSSEQKGFEVEQINDLGTFPIGFAPFESSSFKVGHRNGSGWVDQPIQLAIRQILPRELHSFYFLDGEFLESLHVMFGRIKEGIEEVSHLTIVFNTINHLKTTLRLLEKKTEGMDSDVDKYQEEVHRAEDWLNSTDDAGNLKRSDSSNDLIWKPYGQDSIEYHPISGRPRLESKQQEAEWFRERIAKIDAQLQKHNSDSVQQWSSELECLDKITIPQKTSALDKKIKEKMEHVASIGPEIYLNSCITYMCSLVDEKRAKGELPVKYTEIFINDLLYKKKCICGNDLSKEEPRKILSEWQKQSKLSEKLDSAIEATAGFKVVLGTLRNRISGLDKLRMEINDMEQDIDQYHEKRKIIIENLKNSKEDSIKNLIDERDGRQGLLDKLNREIGAIESDIRHWESRLSVAENQRTRAEQKNVKLRREMDRIYLGKRVLKNLEIVRDSVLDNVRNRVVQYTKENFLKMVWKKDTFSDVTLSDDYKLAVIKNGFNAIHSLSAGEKLVLALSFIAAIRKITGFRMPLIIDTPLGKIAGKPTKNVGKFLSELFQDTQITLLVTDKEYQFVDPSIGQSFRDIIKGSVNKEYLLTHDEKKDMTTFGEMK